MELKHGPMAIAGKYLIMRDSRNWSVLILAQKLNEMDKKVASGLIILIILLFLGTSSTMLLSEKKRRG